jgi:hypothetical protein
MKRKPKQKKLLTITIASEKGIKHLQNAIDRLIEEIMGVHDYDEWMWAPRYFISPDGKTMANYILLPTPSVHVWEDDVWEDVFSKYKEHDEELRQMLSEPPQQLAESR